MCSSRIKTNERKPEIICVSFQTGTSCLEFRPRGRVQRKGGLWTVDAERTKQFRSNQQRQWRDSATAIRTTSTAHQRRLPQHHYRQTKAGSPKPCLFSPPTSYPPWLGTRAKGPLVPSWSSGCSPPGVRRHNNEYINEKYIGIKGPRM